MEHLEEKYGGRRVKVPIDDLLLHPKAQAIYGYRNIEALSDDFVHGPGMIQNPVTNKKFQVIAGWRRVLAAKMAGWTHIFVIVLDNLPEADEEFCIVSSNNIRIKTPREKYHEMRVLERELPNRQGIKPKPGEEKYDQRKALVEKIGKRNTSEAEIRDLMDFDDTTEELLDCIDNKNVFLTPLAAGVRKLNEPLDLTKYAPVVEVNLDTCDCPFCHSATTARIEIIDGKLYYV